MMSMRSGEVSSDFELFDEILDDVESVKKRNEEFFNSNIYNNKDNTNNNNNHNNNNNNHTNNNNNNINNNSNNKNSDSKNNNNSSNSNNTNNSNRNSYKSSDKNSNNNIYNTNKSELLKEKDFTSKPSRQGENNKKKGKEDEDHIHDSLDDSLDNSRRSSGESRSSQGSRSSNRTSSSKGRRSSKSTERKSSKSSQSSQGSQSSKGSNSSNTSRSSGGSKSSRVSRPSLVSRSSRESRSSLSSRSSVGSRCSLSNRTAPTAPSSQCAKSSQGFVSLPRSSDDIKINRRSKSARRKSQGENHNNNNDSNSNNSNSKSNNRKNSNNSNNTYNNNNIDGKNSDNDKKSRTSTTTSFTTATTTTTTATSYKYGDSDFESISSHNGSDSENSENSRSNKNNFSEASFNSERSGSGAGVRNRVPSITLTSPDRKKKQLIVVDDDIEAKEESLLHCYDDEGGECSSLEEKMRQDEDESEHQRHSKEVVDENYTTFYTPPSIDSDMIAPENLERTFLTDLKDDEGSSCNATPKREGEVKASPKRSCGEGKGEETGRKGGNGEGGGGEREGGRGGRGGGRVVDRDNFDRLKMDEDIYRMYRVTNFHVLHNLKDSFEKGDVGKGEGKKRGGQKGRSKSAVTPQLRPQHNVKREPSHTRTRSSSRGMARRAYSVCDSHRSLGHSSSRLNRENVSRRVDDRVEDSGNPVLLSWLEEKNRIASEKHKLEKEKLKKELHLSQQNQLKACQRTMDSSEKVQQWMEGKKKLEKEKRHQRNELLERLKFDTLNHQRRMVTPTFIRTQFCDKNPNIINHLKNKTSSKPVTVPIKDPLSNTVSVAEVKESFFKYYQNDPVCPKGYDTLKSFTDCVLKDAAKEIAKDVSLKIHKLGRPKTTPNIRKTSNKPPLPHKNVKNLPPAQSILPHLVDPKTKQRSVSSVTRDEAEKKLVRMLPDSYDSLLDIESSLKAKRSPKGVMINAKLITM